MSIRTAKRQRRQPKRQPEPPMVTKQQAVKDRAVKEKTFVRPNFVDPADRLPGFAFHAAVLLAGFLIVFSRRPDAITNPQFYAEEGALFYTAAYRFGLESLTIAYGGYLHTLLRLVALGAQLVPLTAAPLFMNIIGITFQVLPVNLFLSSRFSDIPFPIRAVGSFIYLAIPNSFEIDANVTNVQWHLALLACLVLLAQPAKGRWGRIFDGTVLVLTTISSPMGVLLIPVAALLWWARRSKASAISFALLIPGVAIQALTLLLNLHARQYTHIDAAGQPVINGGPNGATFAGFAAIAGRQIFLSALLGLKTQRLFVDASLIEVMATLAGFAVLLYVLRYGPVEFKAFILFAFAVFALGLMNPLAGPPTRSQWDWLSVPSCGNRYYFLPMIAFLASLIWIVVNATSPRQLRYFALALLLLLPVGIIRDWSYPAFEDYNFQEHAEQFERAPSGTKMAIPINPGWLFELTKR